MYLRFNLSRNFSPPLLFFYWVNKMVSENRVKEGDTVLLISPRGKRYLIKVVKNKKFETDKGVISHEEIIGMKYGDEIFSNNNQPFLILQPSIYDIIQSTKRITQIIYPKDACYIVMKLNISSGKKIIEAGTGSGALTIFFANFVKPDGKIFTYEIRDDMIKYAKGNIKTHGMSEFVELKQRDIANGFDEKDVDAVFYDLKNPWDYINQAYESLKPGCYLGCLVPTANQVIKLLKVLEDSQFGDIEVEELLVRKYRTIADRFRPDEKMIGHTGYLLFARKLICKSNKLWYSFLTGRSWKNKTEKE